MPYDADTAALVLARKYLQGGDGAREALHEALDRMGWGVRNAKGDLVRTPPAGTATGLAMRDYEIDELLWKPSEQPDVRLISAAQAMAIPFEGADPEELAQDLIESIRAGAESDNPQRRFWARFIAALGRASPANYDLLAPAPADVIPVSRAEMQSLAEELESNPFAMMKAMQPKPVWPEDDPVLAASPLPKRQSGERSTASTSDRDQKRLNELNAEIGRLSAGFSNPDKAVQAATKEKLDKLYAEMGPVMQRIQAASARQTASMMKKMGQGGNEDEDDEDEDEDGEDGGRSSSTDRFMAEWRDQPLSLLQVSLITRVLAADLHQVGAQAKKNSASTGVAAFFPRQLPFAAIGIAQAGGGGGSVSFGDQFSGAIGDIWATAAGAYTGAVLDHHMPDSKFSKAAGIANVIIAWFKTIVSVARQNITIEVENAPLVRTKTRSPGEQRTVRAKVEIDFPKSDVLKAIRAAGNLTTIDLQLPDGGPVSGAKVVWRLPEGSYNAKYQTAKGGSEYKPELAVVQFAEAGGKAAYVSETNDAGEATITIEGAPQRKMLSKTVREYPRRAAVAVEVTIKVGNMTQDLNDAINTAMGGVVGGGLGFIADMVLRTSFFFQKSKVFEVTDWKEPAWEGEFTITVNASGSKREKGQKGGPDADYSWKMDRLMEGRLHTPDWAEEKEQDKAYDNDGRHQLEVDGDSRYFRLSDSSSARTSKNHNRYAADGPLQVQAPGPNQLELFSRSEPSGSATLTFNGGTMTLDLQPFFGAECLVSRSESGSGGGRSVMKAGPAYLSLLDGVSPSEFTIVEQNDGTQDYIEGSKTFDYRGSLPYVPGFDTKVTVKYRLWKNGPPPKNAKR